MTVQADSEKKKISRRSTEYDTVSSPIHAQYTSIYLAVYYPLYKDPPVLTEMLEGQLRVPYVVSEYWYTNNIVDVLIVV